MTEDQAGFRIGLDRIPGAPKAGTPGPDGPGTMRIGDGSAIRGVDEGGAAVQTRGGRLVNVGRPERSDQVGTPMGFQREVDRPVPVTIGGADVRSRNPDVLVGARKEHFRQDVAKVIAARADHPMRAMIDESTVGTRQPRFVRPGYKQLGGQGRMEDWRRHPEDWEAGHARSDRSGGVEVIVVQTRYRNQRNSQLHENPKTGDGEVTMDSAFVVGGIAVEKSSAWDLWEHGFIDLTYDEMLQLPTLEL
jgi:hypothetical protein